MMNKKQIGKIGEDVACKYLKASNYEIIEKNFNCRQGEIDIIAKDSNTQEMVFVEVKTRNSNKFGRAIEAINRNKIAHIVNSANYYLYKNNISNNIRFDAIEVYTKYKKINHIKQIV